MIAPALKAMADDVERRAKDVTWDIHFRPSPEQVSAKARRIEDLANELRMLADASEIRNVRYQEYDALKSRLHAFGMSLDRSLVDQVTKAFQEAAGSPKPRGPRWWRE